jgi:hypothetical protein
MDLDQLERQDDAAAQATSRASRVRLFSPAFSLTDHWRQAAAA